MRIVLAIFCLCLAIGASAQTIEEQIEAKATEIAALCAQANPGIIKCYVLTQPGQCPDPLVGTRLQLQQASTNLQAAVTTVTAAQQTVDQVLVDNPVP